MKLLVWRQNLDMRMDILSESQWQILNAMTAQHTFAQIVQRLDSSVEVVSELPQLVAAGWISDFKLERSAH